jgi:rubrerythrin
MDIFEFAIGMEKEGEIFYLELANKMSHPELKKIIRLLAADEVKHAQVLKEMRSKTVEMEDSLILSKAKTIFSQVAGECNPLLPIESMNELMDQALDFEKKSEQIYTDYAKKSTDTISTALFMRIAAEEKKHFILLENLKEFLLRPEQWLENAEFNHLDEY